MVMLRRFYTPKIIILGQQLWTVGDVLRKMLKMALKSSIIIILKNKKKHSMVMLPSPYMPKISILGQKLWTLGDGTDVRTWRTENFCGDVHRKVCIFCLAVCINPRLFRRIVWNLHHTCIITQCFCSVKIEVSNE